MLTFVTLTHYMPEAQQTTAIEELETTAFQEIRNKCPEVQWLHNHGHNGSCSYQHIFITPDIDTAEEVACIIDTFGYATTEVWTATDWDTYKSLLKKLPKVS